MGVRRRPWVVLALVGTTVAGGVACSGNGGTARDGAAPEVGGATSPGVTPSGETGPGESPTPPGGSPSRSPSSGSREPLVLVVHPTRAAQDVDAGTARRVANGGVTSWRGFRVVDGVDQVARDVRALAVVPASKVSPVVRPWTVNGIDPLADPERYPLTTTGATPRQVVNLTVGGDVMLGRRVATAAARTGDVARPLRAIGPRLKSADLTVLNLESTLSRAGTAQQGGDSFAAPPGVVAGLRNVGVDVVSLANNHTGDFQDRALVETVRQLRSGGLQPMGAGGNYAEASRPVVVRRDGVRFGFLAFNAIGETPRATATSPGAFELRMPPRTGPLNQADLNALTTAIQKLRKQVDVVAVLPHWGQQYTHEPVPAQRTVAAALTRAGADLVIGGHPHWVQSAQFSTDKAVVHSLGNLVFDMDFARQTQEGVLLELTYWGKTLKAARLTPYVIGADFSPRVVTGARAEQILADLR